MWEWTLPEIIPQTYSPPNLDFCQHHKEMSPHRAETSPGVICCLVVLWVLFILILLYFAFVDAKTPVFIGKKWTKVFLVKTKLTCSLCHPLAAAVYNRNLFLSQYLLGPGLHWRFFHLFQKHEQNPPNLTRRNKLEHRGGYRFRSPSYICTYPNVSWSTVNLNKNTAKTVTMCSFKTTWNMLSF